jgi:hypothetical protein
MPIINGDTIITSAHGMGVVAITPSKQPNGTWTVERLWETNDVSMYVSNPVVIHDVMFGLSERASGQLFALDARNGKTLWLGPPRDAVNTAVAKSGELVFLLNDDAELIVARGSRAGLTVMTRCAVGGSPTWAQPAISGPRFFVKSASALTLWTLD